MMSHADVIERSVEKTHTRLNELAEELDTEDTQAPYRILRAFLYAVRDRLTVEESAQLAAQMPHLIRGIYYEGSVPPTPRQRSTTSTSSSDRRRMSRPACGRRRSTRRSRACRSSSEIPSACASGSTAMRPIPPPRPHRLEPSPDKAARIQARALGELATMRKVEALREAA